MNKTRLAESTNIGISASAESAQNDYRFVNTRESGIDTNAPMGETTVNATDAEVKTAKMSDFKPLTTDIISSKTTFSQDIKAFLSKPVILANGNFSTTDNATTFSDLPLLKTALNNAPYADKLKGFIGFKGTTVLTLQLNGNRFQQGRYLLCFNPTYGSNPSGAAISRKLKAQRFSLWQCTQLPHVEVDVNCDTEAKFYIPFVSAEAMFPIRSIAAGGPGDIGNVFIRPYSTLIAPTGSTTCAYTLWVHFEDVEVYGPTVPQMGVFKPQSLTPAVEEQKAEGLGPVSGALVKVSRAATILKQVPLLSEFAGLTAWSADLAAGVARAFGFSKPINIEHASLMQRTPFHALENYDGVANMRVLGFSKRNELEMLPGFAGSSHDEMTIDYIKKIPSYFRTASWTTSAAASANIASFGPLSLGPGNFISSGLSDNGNLVTCFTPVDYLGTLFTLWRGSITLRLKLVKTEFHSGRLMIVYAPIDARFSVPAIVYGNAPFCYRNIIDIRDGNEFTLNFPYLTTPEWLDTGNQNTTQSGMGQVNLYVLDPLVAPSSVSTSVDILCEVFGGDDLEFAQPAQFVNGPYSPLTPQMGSFVPDPCSLVDDVIGGATYTTSDVHDRLCIGEKITSLRQLLKIPTTNGQYPFTSNAYSYFQSFPWALSFVDGTGTAGSPVFPGTQVDYYSYIGFCFGLGRGSIEYSLDLWTDSKGKSRILALAPSNSQTYNSFWGTDTDANAYLQSGRHPNALENTSLSGGVQVHIPYYNRFHSFPVADALYYNNTVNPDLTQSHMPLINYVWYNNAANTGIIVPRRGVGDDFSFGGFISIPPMVNFGT